MSPTPSYRMDAASFDAAASKLKRWSTRSLRVVRALLVDGEALSDVAIANNMSAQQASVLRARFLTKSAGAAPIQAFMQREKPKVIAVVLNEFAEDLQILVSKGYSVDQLVAYLTENGVAATAADVRKFLRSLR